jgi:hypothetical protein
MLKLVFFCHWGCGLREVMHGARNALLMLHLMCFIMLLYRHLLVTLRMLLLLLPLQ